MPRPMTVRELKELLEQFDDDLPVLCSGETCRANWPIPVRGGGVLPMINMPTADGGGHRIQMPWEGNQSFVNALMLGPHPSEWGER